MISVYLINFYAEEKKELKNDVTGKNDEDYVGTLFRQHVKKCFITLTTA